MALHGVYTQVECRNGTQTFKKGTVHRLRPTETSDKGVNKCVGRVPSQKGANQMHKHGAAPLICLSTECWSWQERLKIERPLVRNNICLA